MSASPILLPSPHDRLDPLAAAVRWWVSRLADAVASERRVTIPAKEVEDAARRRLPPAITIALPLDDLFASRAALPKGGADAHRKALALRLGELAPLDPSALEIAVRRVAVGAATGSADGVAVYAVAMARAERLASLEAAARRRGARSVRFEAEGDERVWLETRRSRVARAKARVVDMILLLALVAAALAASGATTRALERRTEALLAADTTARRVAVEAERTAREAALADDLVAQGVLRRRAGDALSDLAALNAATPDGAWWTRVRWTPDEATLAGAGVQAAEAIETLSAAASGSGWRVSLAGPVRASDDAGRQTFELRATRQGGGDGGG